MLFNRKVFEGKCGIRVRVLADSVNALGNRLTSFEIEYPRLILAELNTHCMLARNSFSSRAVPFEKMLDQLTGRPVRFGANQAGMQDKGEDYDAPVVIGHDSEMEPIYATALEVWERSKKQAIKQAKSLKDAGYHKQVYNRLLEPFQMMKTVISATEWANFFWLRDDDAADPTLRELARVMQEAMDASTPFFLRDGDWHLPYVDFYQEQIEHEGETWWGPQIFYIRPEKDPEHDDAITMADMEVLTLDEAIKVSCARCAAVSYRNEGYGLEKSIEVYDRLVGSDKKHASAFEHCAKAIRPYRHYPTSYGTTFVQNNLWVPMTWEEGITHVDRKGRLWSAKFKGFIQYRKLIPGENYEG